MDGQRKGPGSRANAITEAIDQQVSTKYTTQPADAPAHGEGEIDGAPPALIPPGVYRLRFTHWHTGIYFGRAAKLTAWFSVMDMGEYFQAKLPRYYNVRRLKGKQGKNGGFAAGWNSDLMREYATLLGMPNRNDRIALSRYSTAIIVGEVQTVTTAHDQSRLAQPLQYSVVRNLLSVEAGHPA